MTKTESNRTKENHKFLDSNGSSNSGQRADLDIERRRKSLLFQQIIRSNRKKVTTKQLSHKRNELLWNIQMTVVPIVTARHGTVATRLAKTRKN